MLLINIIMILSLSGIDYPDPTNWPLGPDVSPWRGYGQCNGWSDFHRGLDFHGFPEDEVYAPYPSGVCYILAVGPDTFYYDDDVLGAVLIGKNIFSTYGWLYGHIDIEDPDYVLNAGEFLNRNIITDLATYPDPPGTHVHFAWVEASDEPIPNPGYFNPFDYLNTELVALPYNEAVFMPTEEGHGGFACIFGIVFAIDDNNWSCPDQNGTISEVVDVIVRPITRYFNDVQSNHCGVLSVNWRLLKQNTATTEFEPFGFLGEFRPLFNFGGYIEDDFDVTQHIPEFTQIYMHSKNEWSNNLTLTNACGQERSDASFEGVNHVWIEPYNRMADYLCGNNDFCRGAWDTRLGEIECEGFPAYMDETAYFQDGRYAIQVVAVPQYRRFGGKTVCTLPVDDITAVSPEVTGIIVDNWAPRIRKIRLSENTYQTIRWGSYTANEYNNPATGRSLSYSCPYGTTPSISTGTGTNEYELKFWFSEPVTNLIQQIPVQIKMVTGPENSITWPRTLLFNLDQSACNEINEFTSASYYATGDQPHEYMGRQIVEFTISSDFATDLAGNVLDANAETVAGPGETGDATFTFTEDYNFFYGYYRRETSEDIESRSRDLYAIYDYIYDPSNEDSTRSLVVAENEFTLTGAVANAELFSEVNFPPGGSNCCRVYSGAWMCDNVAGELHLFIVDYDGIVKHDETFYQPIGDNTGRIDHTCVTSIYSEENPYDDRFGWIGWAENIPQTTQTHDNSLHLSDVGLSVTVYDVYNMSNPEIHPIDNGHRWYDPQQGKWYETKIYLMSNGSNGGIIVHLC